MTVKLTVLYGHPESPEAFETHYAGVHDPLARAIPDVLRVETARGLPTADGSAPAYYRVAELWFADLEVMRAAMASEQGAAAGADMANFASGGATMVVSEVDAWA